WRFPIGCESESTRLAGRLNSHTCIFRMIRRLDSLTQDLRQYSRDVSGHQSAEVDIARSPFMGEKIIIDFDLASVFYSRLLDRTGQLAKTNFRIKATPLVNALLRCGIGL